MRKYIKMRYLQVILVIVFVWVGTSRCDKTMADNIAQCRGKIGTDINIRSIKLYRKGDRPEQYFDYDMYITKTVDIKSGLIKVTTKKCPQKDTDAGCNKFPIVNLKNPCDLFHKHLEIKRFLDCLDKEVTCTFERGLYKGRNCSVDASQFRLINLGRHYWSGKIEMLQGKEQLLCMTGQLHMD